MASQNGAATKAALRFSDNSRRNESAIVGLHFAVTQVRIPAARRPILYLDDTTAFNLKRERPDVISKTHVPRSASTPSLECVDLLELLAGRNPIAETIATLPKDVIVKLECISNSHFVNVDKPKRIFGCEKSDRTRAVF